jgi:hypothetical protein
MELENEEKFLMINVATRTLEYTNRHLSEIPEEIIKHMMGLLAKEITPDLKLLSIACMDKVIKLKNDNPKIRDRQILQMFMDSMADIAKRTERVGE